MSRPSNTVQEATENAVRGFGVDWLSVTSPVKTILASVATPEFRDRDGRTSEFFRLGDEKMSGQVYERGGRTWVSIRGNPSRLSDPLGWEPVPLFEAVSEAALVWMNELTEYVEPLLAFSDAKVSRLDVAKDLFDVSHPQRYIRNLAYAPFDLRGGSWRTTKNTAKGETLYWGNNSGGLARLYDKHLESRGRAPRGTVRFEVEAKAWCKQQGIKTVADLTDRRLAHLLELVWERSAFGTPVTTMMAFKKSLLADTSLSRSVKNRAVGMAVLSQDGLSTGLDPRTDRTYKDILRQHGLPLHHSDPEWETDLATCLDLYHGGERIYASD